MEILRLRLHFSTHAESMTVINNFSADKLDNEGMLDRKKFGILFSNTSVKYHGILEKTVRGILSEFHYQSNDT